MRFVNLHGHTFGSLLDAIVRPAEYFARAAEIGYSAVAITDHGNMSQIYPAYKESKKHGVKLIPGNEIYFVENLADPKAKRRHLVLLAANERGYKNLCRITYEGFKNSVTVMNREFPRVDAQILAKYSEGLFATSACGGSIIAAHLYQGDDDGARRHAQQFKDIFGDRFFIELQPHTLARANFNQRDLNNMLKTLAESMGIQMVATCDSHYLRPEHEKYHDMVLAISDKAALSDVTRHRYVTHVPCQPCNGAGCLACGSTGVGEIIECPEFYLKTESEILAFFTAEYGAEFADKLVQNTADIAAKCEPPTYLEPTGERLPKFNMSVISGNADAAEFTEWRSAAAHRQSWADDSAYLRFKVGKAYRAYAKSTLPKEKHKEYWSRLEEELSILESRGFCSYMLIVADLIEWAARNDIWTGPGRGSAGSSLIGFFLGIHKLDPLKYGLLFERFQNRERKQCPDIDSDIISSGRDRVLEYLRSRWGEEHVAMITNVNRITPKVAIKDIAKSLEIGGDRSSSFALADKITKDIPLKVTLDGGKIIEINTVDLALKYSPTLPQFFNQYPEIEEYAKQIVGLPRSWGVHAGGVIVSDAVLPEFVPLRRDKDGVVSVAYDKNIAEEVGLIKIDVLGLDTLDVLRETWQSANSIGIPLPKPWEVPEDDAKVYDLISAGDVLGLFQLEGGTLAGLCKPISPRNIEDIALINALGRPGVDRDKRLQFIERRFGRQPVAYAHPELKEISEPTLGISTYDEDLLRIAVKIAGWPLYKADGLRKLTKLKEKGAALAEQLERDFVADATKVGLVTAAEAQMIWTDVIADYAKYGFCKAHAIAYAKLGYETAYYKCHARAPFLCAHLNLTISKRTPDTAPYIDTIKKEIVSSGIVIRGCDINKSRDRYVVIDRRTIVTGLNAVQGLGDVAISHIFGMQPFSCFEDFVYRSPSAVNRKVIIALAKAGAFDVFGLSRRGIVEVFADDSAGKKLRTQINKWGTKYMETNGIDNPQHIDWAGFPGVQPLREMAEWDTRSMLLAEREVLGEFVSGSADQVFPGFFSGSATLTRERFDMMVPRSKIQFEGIVVGFEGIQVKTGKNAGKMRGAGKIESLRREDFDVSIWPEMWAKCKDRMTPGTPIIGKFTVDEWNGRKTLVLDEIISIWKDNK